MNTYKSNLGQFGKESVSVGSVCHKAIPSFSVNWNANPDLIQSSEASTGWGMMIPENRKTAIISSMTFSTKLVKWTFRGDSPLKGSRNNYFVFQTHVKSKTSPVMQAASVCLPACRKVCLLFYWEVFNETLILVISEQALLAHCWLEFVKFYSAMLMQCRLRKKSSWFYSI